MKKILIAALLFAAPAFADAFWRVQAESPTAIGVGTSYDLEVAKRIALFECARRTPSAFYCTVVSIVWIDD